MRVVVISLNNVDEVDALVALMSRIIRDVEGGAIADHDVSVYEQLLHELRGGESVNGRVEIALSTFLLDALVDEVDTEIYEIENDAPVDAEKAHVYGALTGARSCLTSGLPRGA